MQLRVQKFKNQTHLLEGIKRMLYTKTILRFNTIFLEGASYCRSLRGDYTVDP